MKILQSFTVCIRRRARVDKHIEHVLSKESAHTKADYIPYEGISVTGKVRDVILRGHHVVQDGSLTESYLGECIP